MLKIINQTNVPFEGRAADGAKVRVPAMGSVDASLDVIAHLMRHNDSFRAMHQGGAIKVLPDEDANVDEEEDDLDDDADADVDVGVDADTDEEGEEDEGEAEEEGEGEEDADADDAEGGQ